MAKYTGSPWGQLRGKLSSAVGLTWKSVDGARMHVVPRNPGSISKHLASRDACAVGVAFAPKQMNIRRAVFAMLGYTGRMNLKNWIHPIWEWYCDSHNKGITGINLLIKENARRLYNSFATNSKFTTTNLPTYTLMQVSTGDLEAASSLTSAVYAAGTVTFTWPTATYGNGTAGDEAYAAVYRIPSAADVADYKPYGWLYTPAFTGAPILRGAGTGTITIPAGLLAANLVAYIFFADSCANYSPSVSVQVT